MRRQVKDSLKLGYALGAGLLSVWVASFAPAEGPPIAAYLPADAGAVLQLRSGTEFLRALADNKGLQAFLNDPDVNAVWAPLATRDETLAKLKQAPAIVRWLFPPALASTIPLVGHECIAAFPFPLQEGAGGGPALFFTRLSGSRGHLVRLAAHFAKLPRGVRFFDLGGGLAALGFGGAEPKQVAERLRGTGGDARATAGAEPDQPKREEGGEKGGAGDAEYRKDRLDGENLFLARLTILPHAAAAREQLASAYPQYGQLRSEGLPESVLRALLKPPGVWEMCNLSRPPARIRLDFFSTPPGGFRARGRLEGVALPAAAIPPRAAANRETFAEAVLPVDIRACFLSYLESEMRLRKDDVAPLPLPLREGAGEGETATSGTPVQLARGQRRWSHRFSELADAGVDLERDLWPALGHTLHVSVCPDPLDVAGYARLDGSLLFEGAKTEARDAAAELIRQRWDGAVFEGPPPPNEKPPYVKHARDERGDRYLLNTGRLLVPAWVLSQRRLFFTSNAGFAALRNPALLREPPALEQDAVPGGDAPASAAPGYYLRLDGPSLAPTVERVTTLLYDELEEDMKSSDFLARYPDAALNVRLAAKIACLLGRLSIAVRPEPGKDSAAVELAWTPGAPDH